MCKYSTLEQFGFLSSFNKNKKSDVFLFLIKFNKDKSGFLTKEFINKSLNIVGGFQKYFPELYEEYKKIKFPKESNNWKFHQKLWHFLQDDFELKYGICPICGKRCNMESFIEGYKKYCCNSCVNKSNEHKELSSKTKEIKYGDKNYNNRLKSINTCLERYGVENYTQTNEWKKHSIEINEQRKNKEIETKRKNKTFGTSKIENNCFKWLKEIYPNTKRQHHDDLYPFNCDFFIPEFNLYIEINAYWTHGKHPFDKNNKKDIEILNKWKSKCEIIDGKENQYFDGIDVWTKRDPLKRKTAKENNLNYLEVFSNNFNECKNIINNYINNNLLCQKLVH